MKRIFVCLLFAILVCSTGYAKVDLTEINFSTVTSGTFDRELRGWIDTLNGDIINAGSLFNVGTGQIFFVDSGSGSASFTGLSADRAKASLNGAVGLCEASRGDIIYVMQGHSKTMGAAVDEVDLDVDGITVVCLGKGNDRALFNYTGDVSGAFAVGADNVTIINARFNVAVADCNEGIEIEAGSTDCTIIGCDFTATTEGTHEFKLGSIDSEGAASDRLSVIGCNIRMGGGAAVSGIHALDSDYMVIKNCVITGDFSTTNIVNETTASNHILIQNNVLFNGTIGGTAGLNTEPAIELYATTTGNIINNTVVCNVATSDLSIVAPDCYLSGNTYNETEGGLANAGEFGLIAGKTYTAVSSTTFAASPDTMFTVAGGRILITGLFAELAADAAGSPGTLQVSNNATAGAAWDRTFTTAVNVDSWAQGDLLRFTNAIDQGVIDLTANMGAGQTLSWMASPGVIEQLLSSTGTGGPIAWYMTFIPLEEGVTVTAP